jgi:hypothetical protein
VLQNGDTVRYFNGAHPVRDDHRRPVLHLMLL